MERFLQRHASHILGSISGFDRVLFRGVLRSICYVQGLDYFIGNQRVGFKDFQWFVGQVMKATRGQANPQMVQEILRGELEESEIRS